MEVVSIMEPTSLSADGVSLRRTAKPTFVSVFRINGRPILPPLMTEERREQMRYLRQKAIDVERRITREPCQAKTPVKQQQSVPVSGAMHNDIATNRTSDESLSELSYDSSSLELAQLLEALMQQLSSAKNDERANAKMFKTLTKLDNYKDVSKKIDARANEIDEKEHSINSRLGACSASDEIQNNLQRRMLKLKKSKTVLLDNVSNALMSDINIVDEDPQSIMKTFNYTGGALSPVAGNGIPSIYVQPPTPIAPKIQLTPSDSSVASNRSSSDNLNSSSDEDPNTAKSPHGAAPINKLSRPSSKLLNFELVNYKVDDHVNMPPSVTPQRCSTSLFLKGRMPNNNLDNSNCDNAESPLVRSRSFTLDFPSNALIEHLRQQKEATGAKGALRGHILRRKVTTPPADEERVKRVSNTEPKMRSQFNLAVGKAAASGPGGRVCGGTINKVSPPIKRKSSPYDLPNSRMRNLRLGRKPSNDALMRPKLRSSPPTSSSLPSSNGRTGKKDTGAVPNCESSSPAQSDGVRNKMQFEHRRKLKELLVQQQNEQNRLKRVFETQQKLLLEQFNSEMRRVAVQLSPTRVPLSSNESTPRINSACRPYAPMHANNACAKASGAAVTGSTTRNSSRRRLFIGEQCNDNTATAKCRPIPSEEQKGDLAIAASAATTICAGVRGYLTRRLFQTVQVQRVVQTIRDTLIFVLTLHMESIEGKAEANTPVNIKLKARLLQQLHSASRTLHSFFFQTTVTQRMEMIARDRDRMRAKLAAKR